MIEAWLKISLTRRFFFEALFFFLFMVFDGVRGYKKVREAGRKTSFKAQEQKSSLEFCCAVEALCVCVCVCACVLAWVCVGARALGWSMCVCVRVGFWPGFRSGVWGEGKDHKQSVPFYPTAGKIFRALFPRIKNQTRSKTIAFINLLKSFYAHVFSFLVITRHRQAGSGRK